MLIWIKIKIRNKINFKKMKMKLKMMNNTKILMNKMLIHKKSHNKL